MKLGLLCRQTGAALLLMAALGLAWVRPLRAAEGSGAAAGQSVELQYQQQSNSLCFSSLKVEPQNKPFAKEPALAGHALRRGVLRLGLDKSQDLAFLWDATERRLYLDLNGNQDLTDDPTGVFQSNPRFKSSEYQTFEKVLLRYRTAAGPHRLAGVLHLFDYSRREGRPPQATLEVCGFWSGKVRLQDKDWQVVMVEEPSEANSASALRQMTLRPWSEHSSPLRQFSSEREGFPLKGNLFFDQQAFQVECQETAGAEWAGYRLTFREQVVPLGTVLFKGRFVRRLVLEGSSETNRFVVVQNQPAQRWQLPVGDYRLAQVLLQGAQASAYRDIRVYEKQTTLAVRAGQEAQLQVGGPLTNSIALSREAGGLTLSYSLQGADGHSYCLENLPASAVRPPPGFVVAQAGRQLHQGKFEFG